MVSVVVPQAVEPGTPSPAPQVAPLLMPTHRLDSFRASVAARLRAGDAPALLLREQQAMATALANPAFLKAMASAYAMEMNAQNPNAAYAVPVAEAERQMAVILTNRIRDAQGFAQLLGDAAFLAQATADAQQPAPQTVPYQLPQAKAEEVIRRLVQPLDADGPEPSVHVAASAQGHREVHQALGNIFKPKGVLRALLVHTLAEAWPDATAKQVEDLAASWLKARHDPAHSLADGLAPDGELYKEAMARAETLHTQKMQTAAPPTPVPEQATPAATIVAPAQPTQKLAAEPSLMMDRD